MSSLKRTKSDGYLGNPRVKGDGVEEEWNKRKLREYKKCLQDPVYFARNYVKVISLDKGLVPFDLYPYQEKLFTHFRENRFSVVLACRQSGKCSHPDTVINVKFLDSKEQKITIRTLFEIFSSISRYKLKYFGDENHVFRKQVFEDLQFDNRQTKDVFSKFWRESSYHSKKLWWNRLFGKSCHADNQGALSLPSIVDQDVSQGFPQQTFNDKGILYDGTYQRWIGSENIQDVPTSSGRLENATIGKNGWEGESILWEDSQGSSERISWEGSDAGSKRSYIGNDESPLGGGRIQREDEEEIYQRISNSNVGISQREKTVGITQESNKGWYEQTGGEGTYIKNEDWETPIGGTQEETFSMYDGAGNNKNPCFENITCFERKTKIGITQGKFIQSSKEKGKKDNDMPALFEEWERPHDVSLSFHQLQATEKFIESYGGFGFKVESDTGFERVYQAHKTIKFSQYELKTANGNRLVCADNHIVFDENHNEVFVKNLFVGEKIATKGGFSAVESINCIGSPIHMYDIGVDHENHRFYTNGILSHNSLTSVAFLLWYAIFHPEKTIAILANKGATAREMLGRITLMLENLPFFLQPGCKALNKTFIEFSNNSRIVAAATSGNSIRGMSCVTGDAKICIEDDGGNIFYASIDRIISKGEFTEVKENGMIYCVYKTTNTVNGKVYVGFHGTNDLNDGYMGSGKLIKRAIEKYGIESFTKEILEVFDNKEDAEAYEASIVDRDFTLRDDTYNIAVGGNVRIMHGENNPFFGRSHSDETKNRIREKATGRAGYSQKTGYVGNTRCANIKEFASALGVDANIRNNVLFACGDPNRPDVHFDCPAIQYAAEKFHKRKVDDNARKVRSLSENAKTRFTGVPKTKEHRDRISKGLTGIKRENPQNKNPEKIRKTAEKHRGMKRSEESKLKMSLAKKGMTARNKGKKYYRNPETGQGNYYVPGSQPEGWIQGTGSRK